ncbi:MAG: hypothetical protein ACKPKO_58635, partial [Candidatus Fonsibacter sp.]
EIDFSKVDVTVNCMKQCEIMSYSDQVVHMPRVESSIRRRPKLMGLSHLYGNDDKGHNEGGNDDDDEGDDEGSGDVCGDNEEGGDNDCGDDDDEDDDAAKRIAGQRICSS